MVRVEPKSRPCRYVADAAEAARRDKPDVVVALAPRGPCTGHHRGAGPEGALVLCESSPASESLHLSTCVRREPLAALISQAAVRPKAERPAWSGV